MKAIEFEQDGKRFVVTDQGKFYYYNRVTGLLCEGNQCDNGAGYLSAGLCGRRKYIHRLVAEHFCDKPSPNHVQVNHLDGDKSNNSAENLEWITPSENIRHAHDNGFMENRAKVGSITIRSDEDVEKMYRDYKSGKGVAEVGRLHGFSRTTVSSIVNKRSSRSVTDKVDKEFT